MFDATHVEVKRWFTEGLVDGLRIDHPDGLSDPAGYLAWLREIAGPRCVDRHREDPRRRRAAGADAARRGHHRLRRAARDRRPVRRSQRAAAADRARRVDAVSTRRHAAIGPQTQGRGRHRHAAQRAGPAVPRRRRRTGDDHPTAAGRDRRAAQPHRRVPLGLPVAVGGAAHRHGRNRLADGRNWRNRWPSSTCRDSTSSEAAVRLQQLCGAATAKSDGGLPVLPRRRGWCRSTRSAASPSGSVSASRSSTSAPRVRARLWPHGDDDAVHARHQARRRRPRPHRGAVAGAVAVGGAGRPVGCSASPTRPATGLFLLQNIFGVWPVDGAVTDELRRRLHAYAEKAIREAAVHTIVERSRRRRSKRRCTRGSTR